MPNRLYDDIIGFSGGVDSQTGQETLIDRRGIEFIKTPSEQGGTSSTTQTGRMFDTVNRTFQDIPQAAPTAVRRATQDFDTGATATSQFLNRAGMAPSVTLPSDRDFLAEAQNQFRTLFGNDPNFESMLSEYTNTIRELAEGGRANLEQAKALADERFGIAGERAERGFRESQRSLAEQAFLGEREQQQALVERGLGGSGIAQLGAVQQRIAQGDATSRVYSQFLETVQNLGVAEAESELNFATAVQQLNQATEMQILQEQQRIDGMRMQHNQWRGSTIQALSQAARSNRIQDFQLSLQEWESGLQYASLLDQEARDSASITMDLTRESTEYVIAGIQANPNLNDRQKEQQIAEARRNLVLELNKITASVGLTPEDLVSNILGSAPTPQETTFRNEQGQFRGVIPSIPRAISQGAQSFERGIVGGLFGDQFADIYSQNRIGGEARSLPGIVRAR